MQRRTFLQTAAASTVSLLLLRRARAQSSSAPPLFISVEANAAWDTTTSVDPHAHTNFSLYRNADIREVGGLRVAPFDVEGGQIPFMVRKLTPDGAQQVDFFATYGGFLRVINGIDHRTVSHDIGPRIAFSGTLREGFPALGAMVAAVQGPDRPLAFLSTGGFDDTQGIVTLTRSGNQNLIRELARPNNNGGFRNGATFLTPGVERLVQQAQTERDTRRASLLQARNALAKARRSHQQMQVARGAQDGFLALASVLDASPATGDSNALVAGAGLVLAAMRSDPTACTSAHLNFGNFDTHSDHDSLATGHRARMRDLLEGIGHLIEEIENNPANQALRERGVLIYVSSDFGRTAYNGGEEDDGLRGKDHWPVTSSIVIGLGAMRSQVSGGTTIGRTTPLLDGVAQPGLRAFPFRFNGAGNLVTGASPTASGVDLFPLTATEMNAALRHALRLEEEIPAPGNLKFVDRFALSEADRRFTAVLAEGRNPILKDV